MSVLSLPSICFSKQPDSKIWEFLSDNFYYNKTNLIESSDIISVWTYRTIADEEKKYLIEHFKKSDAEKSKKYQTLDHQTMLIDIDCRKKLSKIEKIENYDDRENVLYEETFKNGEWTSITPESKLDKTYNKLCVNQERQEKIIALRNKCDKECEEWVSSDEKKFFRDKFTHQNHYNTRLGKCFILINYSKKPLKVLKEISENKIYGSFRSKQDGTTILCNVLEKACKSEEEWNALVKPYMEE